jgi:hypothetical protein
MNDTQFQNLLKDAAGDGQRQMRSPADLAGRVRRRAATRRQSRRVGCAVAAVAIVIVGVRWAMHPASPPLQSDRPSIAALRQEIESLRAEAADRNAVVELYLEHERQWQHRPPPPALAMVRQEQERSAWIVMQQAQRMERELDLPQSARKEYQRVVQLFPDSTMAFAARRRLAEISD